LEGWFTQVNHGVRLIFVGGVNEIGGNAVLLEDFEKNVKIFLDFGINTKRYNDHYKKGEFPKNLEELVRINLIPNEEKLSLQGLYTKMFSKITFKQENGKKMSGMLLDYHQSSNLDGILISHPHKDHYLALSSINRMIPVYTGVVTKEIIEAFYKSSKPSLINNFGNLNWKTFRTGDILDIKGMKIVPYHVDHSIPAAYGFIIYSSVGPIIYSGDFRMHGPLSRMTEEFLHEIKTHETLLSRTENKIELKAIREKRIKALICSGTKINKSTIESEKLVEENLNQLFSNNPFDFILVKHDRIDWDRFRTFSNLAKKYEWKYIITEKDAYFYYLLNKDVIHDTMRNPNILEEDHIHILIKKHATHTWQKEIRQAFKEYKKHHRFMSYKQLKQLDGKFFVYITYLDKQLKKNLNFNLKGLFISSSIDPYAEEFYDNTSHIRKELEDYGIPAYRIHASGHATAHDLINFINEINPEILFPIHTEHPEFFQKIFSSSPIKVILPEPYEPIIL